MAKMAMTVNRDNIKYEGNGDDFGEDNGDDDDKGNGDGDDDGLDGGV